jgi:hypothetical protein
VRMIGGRPGPLVGGTAVAGGAVGGTGVLATGGSEDKGVRVEVPSFDCPRRFVGVGGMSVGDAVGVGDLVTVAVNVRVNVLVADDVIVGAFVAVRDIVGDPGTSSSAVGLLVGIGESWPDIGTMR